MVNIENDREVVVTNELLNRVWYSLCKLPFIIIIITCMLQCIPRISDFDSIVENGSRKAKRCMIINNFTQKTEREREGERDLLSNVGLLSIEIIHFAVSTSGNKGHLHIGVTEEKNHKNNNNYTTGWRGGGMKYTCVHTLIQIYLSLLDSWPPLLLAWESTNR